MKELSRFQISKSKIRSHTISQLLAFNQKTDVYDLCLTNADVKALIVTQENALTQNGRYEFGTGIIMKIVFAFCDSPYLTQENYAETIHDLIEIFYHFKNDTLDAIDDDTLIELMKTYFDEVCEGSLELLKMKDLETMAQNLRKEKSDFKTVRNAHHWYEWEEWND